MAPVLIRIADLLFRVLYFMILARVVLSWFSGTKGVLVEILYMITEPILGPIRNFLRRFQSGGTMFAMMDLSPLVAFLLLRIVHSAILVLILWLI